MDYFVRVGLEEPLNRTVQLEESRHSREDATTSDLPCGRSLRAVLLQVLYLKKKNPGFQQASHIS